MCLLKLLIKHDFTIGNRCEKFKCVSYSMGLGSWREKGLWHISERHTIEGDPGKVRAFFADIRKDPRVHNLEISGNTLFFVGVYNYRIPSSLFNPKMFFTKPVYVDNKGVEHWEVACHDRGILSAFLKEMGNQNYEHVEMLQFKDTRLNNIYFPAIAPDLTEKQKRAFELAVSEGYYDIPKRSDLKRLSQLMKISLATYQEHLKRAEAKIIPKLKMD